MGLLPGDGIGPDVMRAAVRVLDAAGRRFGFRLAVSEGLIGEAALSVGPTALPPESVQLCTQVDAVLLGPVGGSHWSHARSLSEPKLAILKLQGWLGAFANQRPIHVHDCLIGISPFKPRIVRGVDLLIVRDASSGLYFSRPRGFERVHGQRVAINTVAYSESEITRVARTAFEAAVRRRGFVILAGLGKLLETGIFWQEVVEALQAAEYSQVRYASMDLDECVLELSLNPRKFDVILAEIAAGDLLSAQAAALTGTFGLHPSAVLCQKSGGLFSPGHGSAPDLEGKGMANPTAAILAGAMCLDVAFGLTDAATGIREAITAAFVSGARTFDVCPRRCKPLSTWGFTERVIDALSAVRRKSD